MDIPGVRFNIDPDNLSAAAASAPAPETLMVSDVLEHTPTATKNNKGSVAPPAPPLLSVPATTGFPLPMRRKERPAARRNREASAPNVSGPAAAPQVRSDSSWNDGSGNTTTFDGAEIAAMNDQWLGSLSEQQLQEERDELVSNMSPELLNLFIKRVSNKSRSATRNGAAGVARRENGQTVVPPDGGGGADGGGNPEQPRTSSAPTASRVRFTEEVEEKEKEKEAKEENPLPQSQPEDSLDPNSPAFLSQLHEKYFPDLPVEPSKMAWMKPPSEQDPADSYSPSLSSVLPSAVRFDFQGRLVPPRAAREIPTYLGLHHHADAPLSAGYTIPELAHLARSSFPAQRCMAFQVLGRIMYRLGIGNYAGKKDGDGDGSGDGSSNSNSNANGGSNTELEEGLWKCLRNGKVLFTLEEAVSGGFGRWGDPHIGVRNYATEALWLWQKGGGKYLTEGDDGDATDS